MHESPTKTHASQTGGGSARMSFPRFPARRRTVEVTLLEGQTVGELMCQYTGEFTEENINTVAQLNKNLKDLDFVRPGTVIRLVDNRAPKLATPEAEWWSARGMGAGATEAGATALDETEVFSEEKNVPATAAPRRADGAVVFGDKENVPAAPTKPQKPSLKQMVNRDGVDMRVPEEA
jgi:hypothetical protein